MHVFKSKFLNYASAAFFTLLMFIAFCADSYRLVPMMAKYAVNLLVLGWAIVTFMIRPDKGRFSAYAFLHFTFFHTCCSGCGHWESGFLNFRRLIISCADR